MKMCKILLFSFIFVFNSPLFASSEAVGQEVSAKETGTKEANEQEIDAKETSTKETRAKEINEKDTSNFLFEHEDEQYTFLYPIVDDAIKLQVTIPKNFKPLQGNPEAELLEFIPKTDKDSYKWSEIISLTKILGTGITAKEYISKMEELFKKNVDAHSKVLERDKHTYVGYQDASSIIRYQANGREEIVILYSISGPLDIANVQYAVPLSSSDKVQQSVQKLKDFIKNNLEVIKAEKRQVEHAVMESIKTSKKIGAQSER